MQTTITSNKMKGTKQMESIIIKTQIKRFAAFLILLVSLQSCHKDDIETNPLDSTKYKIFSNSMRKLWSDHATWTRNLIIDIAEDAPGTAVDFTRLLKNQEDIGEAIKPYYSEEAGDKLTYLLKEHIVIARNVFTATKSRNTDDLNLMIDSLYENGDAIAMFLSTANPMNWKSHHMKEHMKEYIDLTLSEATNHLNGNYQGSIEAYDEIYSQLLHLADQLSSGIALQFPEKF